MEETEDHEPATAESMCGSTSLWKEIPLDSGKMPLDSLNFLATFFEKKNCNGI